MPAPSTIALYGAPFAGIDLFMRGIRDVTSAQILHIGSGGLSPFLKIADAWIYLHDEARENIPLLLSTGLPIVSRSLPTFPLGLTVAHIDDETAARTLAQHQIAQGARSLVYWGMNLSFSHRRSAGTRAAATTAKIPFTETHDLPTTIAAIRAAEKPAGFVGMNDEWCHKVAAALANSDLAIPRDVLLAGFDNAPQPLEPWAVPLTTVVIPLREQGRRCAELLLAEREKTTVHIVPVPPPLIRASTLPRRAPSQKI